MKREVSRGMKAVADKAINGKKRPVLAKKGRGPGMAVMIAIGAPKKGMGHGMPPKEDEEMPMEDYAQKRKASTEATLAKMEARIAKLERDMAQMHDGEAMDEEYDSEMEDEEEDEDEED